MKTRGKGLKKVLLEATKLSEETDFVLSRESSGRPCGF